MKIKFSIAEAETMIANNLPYPLSDMGAEVQIEILESKHFVARLKEFKLNDMLSVMKGVDKIADIKALRQWACDNGFAGFGLADSKHFVERIHRY